MKTFDSLADAYRQGLVELLRSGSSVESVLEPNSPASGFGAGNRPALELLGYSFEVRNPRACLVDSEARPLRLAYCFGSLLWTLAGSDDLAHLQSYHPAARNFSDDGISLSGAFGKRLFNYGGEINQIDIIADRLIRDRASRRTFAAICDAGDNLRSTREYPCCIGLQFFLRHDKLHVVTYMRAQHALLILPYDAFLFMSIQCLVAARLGVDVGTYRHMSGTFHIYESERSFAERVLSAPILSVNTECGGDKPCAIADALEFEDRARIFGLAGDVQGLQSMFVTPGDLGVGLARQAKLVILAHWLHETSSDGCDLVLESLPASFQNMLMRQWLSTEQGQTSSGQMHKGS